MTDARFPESKTDAWGPDSSLVEDVLYNRETQELAVSFHRSDDYYVYPNVPAEVAKAFQYADSAGAFYNTYVKPYGPGEVVGNEYLGWTCDCIQKQAAVVKDVISYSGINDVKAGDIVRILDTPYARGPESADHIGTDTVVTEVVGPYLFTVLDGDIVPFRPEEVALVRAAEEPEVADEPLSLDGMEFHEIVEVADATINSIRASLVNLEELLAHLAESY